MRTYRLLILVWVVALIGLSYVASSSVAAPHSEFLPSTSSRP